MSWGQGVWLQTLICSLNTHSSYTSSVVSTITDYSQALCHTLGTYPQPPLPSPTLMTFFACIFPLLRPLLGGPFLPLHCPAPSTEHPWSPENLCPSSPSSYTLRLLTFLCVPSPGTLQGAKETLALIRGQLQLGSILTVSRKCANTSEEKKKPYHPPRINIQRSYSLLCARSYSQSQVTLQRSSLALQNIWTERSHLPKGQSLIRPPGKAAKFQFSGVFNAAVIWSRLGNSRYFCLAGGFNTSVI